MLDIEFTEEEIEKIAAVEASRSARREKRNKETAAACKKALIDVGFDASRLIIFEMPEGMGGAVIHRLPAPEMMAANERRITKTLMSDGKKDDYAATVAWLVENKSLLVHPDISELQAWQSELPGLYGQLKGNLEARTDHGTYMGKSIASSARRAVPQNSSDG
jgi:hypothetical protein